MWRLLCRPEFRASFSRHTAVEFMEQMSRDCRWLRLHVAYYCRALHFRELFPYYTTHAILGNFECLAHNVLFAFVKTIVYSIPTLRICRLPMHQLGHVYNFIMSYIYHCIVDYICQRTSHVRLLVPASVTGDRKRHKSNHHI